MAAPGSFTSGSVLTAAEMNALPGGLVTATAGGTGGYGYVQVTSDRSMTTSEADVTDMTVTFTADAARVYRFTFDGLLESGSNVYINVDGANRQRGQNDSGGFCTVMCSAIVTGLSGSVVAKMRAASNSGTTRIEAGSGRPAVFYVEDVGGA